MGFKLVSLSIPFDFIYKSITEIVFEKHHHTNDIE